MTLIFLLGDRLWAPGRFAQSDQSSEYTRRSSCKNTIRIWLQVWPVAAAAKILVGRCGSERANRAGQKIDQAGGRGRFGWGGRLLSDAWHGPDRR